MFTGLVEKIGRLVVRDERGDGVRLELAHSAWDTPLAIGESVAVHGVCLTVTRLTPGGFGCDILRETLDKTNLGARKVGDGLNLERAMRADDRFGGHFVSGHVDGTGVVREVRPQGDDIVVAMTCPRDMIRRMVPKGSVAVDGVSLTIARLESEYFEVCIIPHTRTETTFGVLVPGDPVNIELDMIGKFVMRYMENADFAKQGDGR
jgi:riboflavin synthase